MVEERLVNINLRNIPLSLRQSLKKVAVESGITMEALCLEALRVVVDSGNLIRAGGQAASGGISIPTGGGVDGRRVAEGVDSGAAASGAGSPARGVEQGGKEGGEGGREVRAQRGRDSGGDPGAAQTTAVRRQDVGKDDAESGVATAGTCGRGKSAAGVQSRGEGGAKCGQQFNGTLELRGAGSGIDQASAERFEDLSSERQAEVRAEYNGMMEQVVLTIDRELRKDAGLPPINLTAVCIHSKPITEECPECVERWGRKAAFLGQFCAKCGRKRAYHLWFDGDWWCDADKTQKFDVDVIATLKAGGEKAFQDTLADIEKVQAPGLSGEPVNKEPFRPSTSPQVVVYDPNEASAAASITGEVSPILTHSHVLSSADPVPRVVDTAKEAADTALRMKKPPAGKKEKRLCRFCKGKMERWSTTTLRCMACGRNEAI